MFDEVEVQDFDLSVEHVLISHDNMEVRERMTSCHQWENPSQPFSDVLSLEVGESSILVLRRDNEESLRV